MIGEGAKRFYKVLNQYCASYWCST